MMLYALLCATCLGAVILSIVSVRRAVSDSRLRLAPAVASTPVSVLKPLCGADDDLEANLETFFRQDHRPLELVFGVEGGDDPAVPVVQRLRIRYPEVPCRLVVHDGRRGLNPKVSNLLAMRQKGLTMPSLKRSCAAGRKSRSALTRIVPINKHTS